MLFSSFIFLFLFLPLVVPFSLVRNIRIQNFILLLASLIFYAWGGVIYTLIMIISILMNYTAGLLIARFGKYAKSFLVAAITLNIGMLCVFKYMNFIVASINGIAAGDVIKQTHIALPIGISFFTFHGLSYVIDIYRKKFPPQKDLSILALYITLFPQLIAGPIIRYKEIYSQFYDRSSSAAKFS